MKRSAGILMPIFSLPSRWGIGTMGQAARDFVRFLRDSGQSYWQLLPICPTGYGDSPYQSFSSFAGNPYFIDLDDLASEGLLKREEYAGLEWGDDPGRVDYGLLYRQRYPVLRTACRRLLDAPPSDYGAFLRENAFWLEDYALFMAIKASHGGQSWEEWPEEERHRLSEAMGRARRALSDEVDFWRAVQYLFTRQWNALKTLAHENGVSIIGDLPIYVSLDSADVWAAPGQFQLDEDLRPTEVAGCPPDAFTEDGQLWGNPLFRWNVMKADGYSWWLRRIEYQFRVYDVLRMDHFRGFDAYYAIPFGQSTARNGRWRPGPGGEFFQIIRERLGPCPIIAEDLGFLTDSVRKLLADTGCPGMKVLEFGFDSETMDSEYLPHKFSRNCVVYTGTHDNATLIGWLEEAPAADVAYVRDYLRLNRQEGYHWGIMRGAWACVADLAVIQMQDLLGLGRDARINIPSTASGNWQWRMLSGQIPATLPRKLYRLMELYGRLPS